jgi:WD40 repeat protein
MPYEEEDKAFFFGRTTDIGLITANLLASRLTLLYGASGVGKSSVLNAGVVPALRNLASSNREQLNKPELAVVVFRDWAHSPARALALAVRQASAHAAGIEPSDLPEAEALLATLHRGSAQVGGDVLVILDQFEEHFLYPPAADDTESFDDALVVALNDRELRANFLLSIREDGLSKLDHFKGCIPKLFDNYLRIQHIDTAAGKEAIEKPVERYNELCRAGQPLITLGDGLVKAVLDEVQTGRVVISDTAVGGVVAAADAETRIETPFLQLVMTQLWEAEVGQGSTELRRSTFVDTLGGARSIVQSHVRSTLKSLSPDETSLAVKAFRYLITPSRTKIALPAADLAAIGDLPPQPLAHLLENLTGSGYRILKTVAPPPDQPGVVSYEIRHDVLAQPILDWRAEQVQLAEVEAMRERSQGDLQAVRQQAKRSLITTIIVSVCLGLSLLAGVYGWWQSNIAQGQRDIAQEQARNAGWRKLMADVRIVLATDPELGLLLGRHALRETMNAKSGIATEAADALALALSTSRVRQSFPTGVSSHGPVRVDVAEHDAALAVLGGDGHIIRLGLANGARRPFPVPPSTFAVFDMALSPDGTQVALAVMGKDKDSSIQILDATSGSSLQTIPLDATPVKIAWSPDNLNLASATEDGRTTLWNTASGKGREFPALPHDSGQWIVALDFSPDGRWLAGAGGDRVVRVWSVVDAREQKRICGHSDHIMAVRFTPDSQRLASSSMDGTALLWSLDARDRASACASKPLLSFVGHFNTVFDLRFSPDGQTLATASADTTVRLWDVGTGKMLLTLLGHIAPVEQIAFLERGTRIASISWDGSTRVWDVAQYADPLIDSDNSMGGRRVVTLSRDGRVAVSETTSGEVYRQGRFAGAEVVALDRDGERVALGYIDGRIEVWAVADSRLVARLPAHHKEVTALVISPDGRQLASGGADGWARRWDVDTRQQLDEANHQYKVTKVFFSPDQRFLFTGGENGDAQLWDLGQGRRIALTGHSKRHSDVAWSHDGGWLATASHDGTARLWTLPDGSLRHTLKHPSLVFDVAFSNDDRHLLTMAGDNLGHRYDVATGAEILPNLVGHESWVPSGSYSPDGERIATGSWDRTARLWDANTGAPLASYTHDQPLVRSAFSPDGLALITVSETAQVRHIPLDAAQLLRLANERATRSLNALECKRYLGLESCPPASTTANK